MFMVLHELKVNAPVLEAIKLGREMLVLLVIMLFSNVVQTFLLFKISETACC